LSWTSAGNAANGANLAVESKYRSRLGTNVITWSLQSPEVAAAGHNRCIIPLPETVIEPWLNPDAKNLNAVEALLDERERPVYAHRLAA
jgi:hypothetical protein